MVPQCSVQIPRVRTYSGYGPLSFGFAYKTLTSYGVTSHSLRLPFENALCRPQPRMYFYLRFSLFRFRSPLLAESLLISFSADYKKDSSQPYKAMPAYLYVRPVTPEALSKMSHATDPLPDAGSCKGNTNTDIILFDMRHITS